MSMSVSLPSVCVPGVWFDGRFARNIHVDFPDRYGSRYCWSTQSIARDISAFIVGDIIFFSTRNPRRLFDQSKYEPVDGCNYSAAQCSRFKAIWDSLLGPTFGKVQLQAYAILRWIILLDLQLLVSGWKEHPLRKKIIEYSQTSRWCWRLRDEQRQRRARMRLIS